MRSLRIAQYIRNTLTACEPGGSHTKLVSFYLVIASCICLFLMLICVIAYLIWRTVFYEERKLVLLKSKLLQGFPSDETTDYARKFLSLPLQAKKYIKRIATESFSILGEGNYGIVFASEIVEPTSGGRYGVAVKGLRDRDRTFQGMDTFVKEIKLMLYITDTLGGHTNVVKFIGTDISKFMQKEIYLIMENCEHGSLLNYLRKCSNRVSEIQLHRWCFEISEGMNFLSQNNIIHIDLAARNVLLDANNQAKISDFGLSRLLMLSDYYRDRGHVPFPARWTALELLDQNGRITTKSDVWSFGVTAWEIFSLGKEPSYEGAVSITELRRKLEIGIRLERPALTDAETYANIYSCWNEDPSERPTFLQIGNFFLKRWQNGSDLDLNPEAVRAIMQDVQNSRCSSEAQFSNNSNPMVQFAAFTYTTNNAPRNRESMLSSGNGSMNRDHDRSKLMNNSFDDEEFPDDTNSDYSRM